MEQVSLKSNNFEDDMITAMTSLKENQSLTDVTLFCEDNQQIKAHKVVLSASSTWFMNIFLNIDHSHPIIYMRALNHKELLSLIDFLYKGEVTINQEELQGFMDLARELGVKGLINANIINKSSEEIESVPEKYTEDANLLESLVETMGEGLTQGNVTNINNIDIDFVPDIYDEGLKQENLIDMKDEKMASVTDIYNEGSNSTESLLEIPDKKFHKVAKHDKPLVGITIKDFDNRIDLLIEGTEDRLWKCSPCGKTSESRHIIKRHIEAYHLEGVGIPCEHCNRTYKTKNALRSHFYRKHRIDTELLESNPQEKNN